MWNADTKYQIAVSATDSAEPVMHGGDRSYKAAQLAKLGLNTRTSSPTKTYRIVSISLGSPYIAQKLQLNEVNVKQRFIEAAS